jgi:PAS domain-containing protein
MLTGRCGLPQSDKPCFWPKNYKVCRIYTRGRQRKCSGSQESQCAPIAPLVGVKRHRLMGRTMDSSRLPRTSALLRDQEGRIVDWYGLSVDIDEGKKAEDRLRHSEAYLAEAQRLSHTGSAANNETEILYLSEEASRIWGLDQLQGVPSREAVWQRIHPDDLERVHENIQRSARKKKDDLRMSSESFFRMERSSISKQPTIPCFRQAESFWRLSSQALT